MTFNGIYKSTQDTFNWRKVEIDYYLPGYNKYNQALCGTCYFCKHKATHIVTRTSNNTDETFTDLVCVDHAIAFLSDEDRVLCPYKSTVLPPSLPGNKNFKAKGI